MIPVKICGITCLKDALCAAKSGAQAVGFIFYQSSPRYITPDKAVRIIAKLPQELVKVGVFVNEEAALVMQIWEQCGLDMLQFHGDELPDYCRLFLKVSVIKALELKTAEDVKKTELYNVAAILADSRHAGLYGGTGKTSDWELAGKIRQPLILSGGLNENNVKEALQKASPDALDINSGVESAPGKKDAEKIKRLMEILQNQESNTLMPQIFKRRDEL